MSPREGAEAEPWLTTGRALWPWLRDGTGPPHQQPLGSVWPSSYQQPCDLGLPSACAPEVGSAQRTDLSSVGLGAPGSLRVWQGGLTWGPGFLPGPGSCRSWLSAPGASCCGGGASGAGSLCASRADGPHPAAHGHLHQHQGAPGLLLRPLRARRGAGLQRPPHPRAPGRHAGDRAVPGPAGPLPALLPCPASAPASSPLSTRVPASDPAPGD